MEEAERKAQMVMNAVVSITADDLTDIELNALALSAMLGGDPRNVFGYDKVSHLYTEKDGTRMHEETKRAFLAVHSLRLGSQLEKDKS